jgi:hypothetical protein
VAKQEYKTVSFIINHKGNIAKEVRNFDNEVQKSLNEGWKISGSISINVVDSLTNFLLIMAQPMLREID